MDVPHLLMVKLMTLVFTTRSSRPSDGFLSTTPSLEAAGSKAKLQIWDVGARKTFGVNSCSEKEAGEDGRRGLDLLAMVRVKMMEETISFGAVIHY
jgi:hypothetical protein